MLGPGDTGMKRCQNHVQYHSAQLLGFQMGQASFAEQSEEGLNAGGLPILWAGKSCVDKKRTTSKILGNCYGASK